MANKLLVIEDSREKKVKSKNYNYYFNKKTGLFLRWGETKENDPTFSPVGPEILDLEISTGGDCLGNCPFCYKSNGGSKPTYNMSLDDFKNIFHKLHPILTQIAFGIMNISTNPDFFKMMEYARSFGVIPNYTCHGLDVTPKIAKKTAKICGAVAVSVYNKEKSYDAIKMFTDAGMSQVNIHFLLAKETYKEALEVVKDIMFDPRLEKLNAIVFLQLKKKGRAETNEGYNYIKSVSSYKRLIDFCEANGVNYGFDSCSAPLYFKTIEKNKDYNNLVQYAEPCESGLFSSYINCKGEFFPCSFAEGEGDWATGLNVLRAENFVEYIWTHPKLLKFREELLNSSNGCKCKSKKYCRSCSIYEGVAGCKYE